jgi:hypothetical protein
MAYIEYNKPVSMKDKDKNKDKGEHHALFKKYYNKK